MHRETTKRMRLLLVLVSQGKDIGGPISQVRGGSRYRIEGCCAQLSRETKEEEVEEVEKEDKDEDEEVMVEDLDRGKERRETLNDKSETYVVLLIKDINSLIEELRHVIH
ncbi:hypothetical protein V1478_002805, partial [Vespula squamosa]